MRKIYLILIVLIIPSISYATNGFDCTDEEYKLFSNDCVNHPKLKNEAGIGTDVILWKNEDKSKLTQEFFAEYRYDANNDNHKIYGVIQFNLWDKIKGLFHKENKVNVSKTTR